MLLVHADIDRQKLQQTTAAESSLPGVVFQTQAGEPAAAGGLLWLAAGLAGVVVRGVLGSRRIVGRHFFLDFDPLAGNPGSLDRNVDLGLAKLVAPFLLENSQFFPLLLDQFIAIEILRDRGGADGDRADIAALLRQVHPQLHEFSIFSGYDLIGDLNGAFDRQPLFGADRVRFLAIIGFQRFEHAVLGCFPIRGNIVVELPRSGCDPGGSQRDQLLFQFRVAALQIPHVGDRHLKSPLGIFELSRIDLRELMLGLGRASDQSAPLRLPIGGGLSFRFRRLLLTAAKFLILLLEQFVLVLQLSVPLLGYSRRFSQPLVRLAQFLDGLPQFGRGSGGSGRRLAGLRQSAR